MEPMKNETQPEKCWNIFNIKKTKKTKPDEKIDVSNKENKKQKLGQNNEYNHLTTKDKSQTQTVGDNSVETENKNQRPSSYCFLEIKTFFHIVKRKIAIHW